MMPPGQPVQAVCSHLPCTVSFGIDQLVEIAASGAAVRPGQRTPSASGPGAGR